MESKANQQPQPETDPEDVSLNAVPTGKPVPHGNPSGGDRSLFPLRLSDFEFYMLTDDRPSHPMVFVMDVVVRGRLEEAPFRASIDELLKFHPLLRCCIQQVPKLGWSWVELNDQSLASRCQTWQTVDESQVMSYAPPVRPIDICRNAGWLIEVVAGPESARVIFHLHHCCTDGIGGLQIVGELFARYGQQTVKPGAKRPEIDPIVPNRLSLRENYEAGESAAQRQTKSIWKIAGKISRLMFRFPVVLGVHKPLVKCEEQPRASAELELSRPDRPAIRSRVLPKATYRALRAVASEDGVSINDLLLAEMILHIRDWNRRANVSMRGKWIRIAVPLSMRTTRHEGMPCTNIVSYALVTRRVQDCEDESKLLKSIHQQTSDVLFNREGMVCLKLFRVLRKIPRAMKAFLGSKSVLSTLVLANVGDVRKRFAGRFPLDKGRWVAGNVIVESIHGVAPVRRNTRAAMSIGDYAGDLSLSLRTDSTVMGDAESELFLAQYVDRLTSRIRSVTNVDANEEPLG